MTDGIATLSLEPVARKTKRASQESMRAAGLLRDFVFGTENSLLCRAIGWTDLPSAPRLAEPAYSLNFEVVPTTVHAPSGFGKSHLLQALAATWARERPNSRVVLLSGADFARAYANAVKLDDIPRFQQKLQRADLLLVDRLEDLHRKSGAQRQLATIIDHRQDHHRPLILTTQLPLRMLNLTARLVSRLAGGLMIPLELPTREARRVILGQLCQERGLAATSAALDRLSDHEPATVPQLSSLLNRLAHDHQGLAQIDELHVASLLENVAEDPVNPHDIIRITAQFFGLKVRNLTGTSRRKMDVLARSIAMHLMRELTPISFQQIGRYFGRRDHTTVMHAHKKMSVSRRVDKTTKNALAEITRYLKTITPPAEDAPSRAVGPEPMPGTGRSVQASLERT